MMPLLMTTVMTIVREQDRGRIMGNVTLAMSVAPALGPTVSGPDPRGRVVALDVPAGAAGRGRDRPGRPAASSPTSARPAPATSTGPASRSRPLGFGPLVYGLSELGGPDGAGRRPGAASPSAWPRSPRSCCASCSLQRTGTPLLDLRTLQHRTFTVGLLLMSVAFMAMLGSMILLPFYLQDVHGLDELQSGLMVMPGGLAMGLLGPQVGKVYDRVGAPAAAGPRRRRHPGLADACSPRSPSSSRCGSCCRSTS